jgi:hypothetical protein
VIEGSIDLTLKITGFLTMSDAEYAIYLLSLIQWNVPPNLLGQADTVSSVLTLTQPTISNICFPAGTLITIDQGLIPIDHIDTRIHTIGGQAIRYITQTVTLEKYLICFPRNSIEWNYPSETTIMTSDHKIEYRGHMVPAHRFLQMCNKVKKVIYTGEILYNVLLAKPSKMMINNLVCETLHPENIIAKLYTNDYTDEMRNNIIGQINDSLVNKDTWLYKHMVKKIKADHVHVSK